MPHRNSGSWIFSGSLALLVGCGAAPSEQVATPANATTPSSEAKDNRAGKSEARYRAIVDVDHLKPWLSDPKVVLVDVRSADDYAKGHIPGAINMPADAWRTAAQKPGKDSHDIFTKSDGSVDTPRYEALLGAAGITPGHKVLVYGNHSGKADGSVPAMVLLALGHSEVGFVDGVAFERWKAAGNPVLTEVKKLPPTSYKAQPPPNFVWSTEQVKQALRKKDVVFVDARTAAEFAGTDARDNKRAGHIPGAVNVNYEELLTKDKRTVSPADARQILEQRGITPDKKVVVYCQTGTRASHDIMVLRDLGYSNIALYDASWQDWGNREDTPIDKPGSSSATSAPQ